MDFPNTCETRQIVSTGISKATPFFRILYVSSQVFVWTNLNDSNIFLRFRSYGFQVSRTVIC